MCNAALSFGAQIVYKLVSLWNEDFIHQLSSAALSITTTSKTEGGGDAPPHFAVNHGISRDIFADQIFLNMAILRKLQIFTYRGVLYIVVYLKIRKISTPLEIQLSIHPIIKIM